MITEMPIESIGRIGYSILRELENIDLAIDRGEPETVSDALIAKLCGVNESDARGSTPLHHAAQTGDRDFAKLLLNLGVDVDARNFCRQTPLHLAVLGGHSELVALLLARGADNSLLLWDLCSAGIS